MSQKDADAIAGRMRRAVDEILGTVSMRQLVLTDEIIRKAVDAYDAERCRTHGQSVEAGGMSEANKRSIAPMIAAAIHAAIEEWEKTSK